MKTTEQSNPWENIELDDYGVGSRNSTRSHPSARNINSPATTSLLFGIEPMANRKGLSNALCGKSGSSSAHSYC